MIALLIKLLGGHLEHVGHILHAAITSGGGIPLPWLLLMALVLGAATYLSYRRTIGLVSFPRRFALMALRITFYLLLLALMARPILSLTVQGSTRRTLLLLIDISKSMSIEDPRTTDDDRKRSAIADGTLSATKGLEQSFDPASDAASQHRARIDVVRDTLKNQQFKLLSTLQKDYNLDAYAFAGNVSAVALKNVADPAGDLAGLKAEGPSTAMGDAMREVLRLKRGQPLAGIVLITDGGNNKGTPPQDAAQLAADQQAPVFAYGVGVTSPRDIVVSNVFAEPVAFSKDELPVSVRVRSQGMIGQKGTLFIKLGQQTVAQKEVTFDHNGEFVVNTHFIPDSPGEYALSATIPPREDEAVKDNNAATQHLRVIDGKIKVLFIDSAPRWDFKYLQAMLLRDRRVSAKFVLTQGDPAIAKAEGSPYLAGIPTDRKEFFKYDLIVLGDLAPDALTKDQQDMLNEFVSKFGGALVFIAGHEHNPVDYVNTPLEKMLPVVPGKAAEDQTLDKPTDLEITANGQSNPMMMLSDNEAENHQRWADFPPLYWTAAVEKPKPGAQVLIVDADPAKASRFGKMPVFALQSYGLGQVLFIGTDETWRWRKNDLVPFHDAMWSQMIQRLGLPHLLGLSQKIQLTSDKQKYTVGDKVTVYARVYGDNFEPATDDSQRGAFISKEIGTTDAVLRLVPDQPGFYRGEFVVPKAGQYNFNLEKSPGTKLAFEVEDPKIEMGETAMNEALLREVAATSGGQFFREEDLYTLPDRVRAKTAQVQTSLDVELWSSPLFYILLVGIVSTEWILRKTAQLK